MNRRLLCIVAAISALLMATGLFVLDRPLAEWVHSGGFEQARVFSVGLGALDTLSGMNLWFWLAGAVALALGLAGLALRRHARWPRALIAAGLVQTLCIETMILGKNHFGRLRPQQVLDSGDWSQLWFAGGGSFPSGHSAFYFGLLLPLAAACPIRWLRALLIAIPVYVVLARIDLARHFLSDVSASALMAALYALLVATLAQRWLPAPGHSMQSPPRALAVEPLRAR
ncbi:phosphatase PAP2 family protein [Dokdonella soli]|uniref:Phosphatidic acid phosphatase type 2/haloperoxidase domain-containing protein n=1 Tax=Dokdonella soli TaxID=529810 RepID=A0ABN1IW54_9GAMM